MAAPLHPRYRIGVNVSAVPPATSSGPPVILDVAIVGAGPAGCAAALALQGSGLRVGLIEKAVPPRHKTCGGGVVARVMALLPAAVRAAVERECHLAELVHHDPGLRFACWRDEPIISMVMRDRFDHLLTTAAQETGTILFAATPVLDVVPGPKEVRLLTNRGEFRARYVIAADGVNSVVARKIGRPALRHVVPALECEVTFAEAAMAPLMQSARFDFGLVPAGYGWAFPKKDHLSIGVLTTRPGRASLPQEYRRYLAALGLGEPLHEERHGFMIPCRPRDDLFGAPRILLVGDAAGLADPLTAEGITDGVMSGQLAARAIALGGGDERAVMRTYRATLEKALLGELRVARLIARVVYGWPRIRGAVLRRRGQRASELLTSVVTGETSYTAIMRRPENYRHLFFGRG